jgi:uncharacterized protein with FMN-binding domain
MMTTRQKKIGLSALAGVSLSVALAGCATDATAESGSGSAAETPAASAAASAAPTPASTAAAGDSAASSTYQDGTYEAKGSYTSPNGQEEIDVSLTLAGDVITAVTVTPEATNPNSVNYQTQFADGISEVVVGKDIDEIDVSRVAGSSLTSGGFNEAVETIKSDAA